MAPRPGVLVVTGASRGIGRATAELAGRHGWAVCVNYRADADGAQAAVSAIEQAGGTAIAVRGDVAVEADILALFAAVDQRLGRVSALVNNAGIAGPGGRIDELSATVLHDVFAANVFGSFLCTREALRRMSTRHGGAGGSIVFVSSQAAQFGGNLLGAYPASKAALNTLTVGLAREVAAEGVRVNAVSPGVIETDQLRAVTEERRARLMASLPTGRMGQPEEVAETILWLISDAASYVSGAIVPVHGAR